MASKHKHPGAAALRGVARTLENAIRVAQKTREQWTSDRCDEGWDASLASMLDKLLRAQCEAEALAKRMSSAASWEEEERELPAKRAASRTEELLDQRAHGNGLERMLATNAIERLESQVEHE